MSCPHPSVTPEVHHAFRFVRMCGTSDDLFDSYRNLFLAFESLLSDIRPRQKRSSRWRRLLRIKPNGRWEGERHWFKEALSEADKLVSIASLTPPEIRNHRRWILRWMYSAERSALMHAKQGEDYLLPQDDTRRAELIASLGKLWDYIRKLIEENLDVTAGGGALFGPGWAMRADPVLANLALFVAQPWTKSRAFEPE